MRRAWGENERDARVAREPAARARRVRRGRRRRDRFSPGPARVRADAADRRAGARPRVGRGVGATEVRARPLRAAGVQVPRRLLGGPAAARRAAVRAGPDPGHGHRRQPRPRGRPGGEIERARGDDRRPRGHGGRPDRGDRGRGRRGARGRRRLRRGGPAQRRARRARAPSGLRHLLARLRTGSALGDRGLRDDLRRARHAARWRATRPRGDPDRGRMRWRRPPPATSRDAHGCSGSSRPTRPACSSPSAPASPSSSTVRRTR